jgi:tetratricopeptide (TPR) repeat protein
MPTLDEAKKNIENGNYEEALKVLHTLLKHDPCNTCINFEAARAYLLSGNIEEAVKLLKNIMKNDCRDVYVFELFFKIIKAAIYLLLTVLWRRSIIIFQKNAISFLKSPNFFLILTEQSP